MGWWGYTIEMFRTYFVKLFFWLNRSHENPTSGELRLRKSQKGDHMTHLGHQGWWNSLHPPPPSLSWNSRTPHWPRQSNAPTYNQYQIFRGAGRWKFQCWIIQKGPSEIVLSASFFTIFFGGLRCNSLLSFELSGQAGICLKQLVLIGRRRLSGAGGRQLGWAGGSRGISAVYCTGGEQRYHAISGKYSEYYCCAGRPTRPSGGRSEL